MNKLIKRISVLFITFILFGIKVYASDASISISSSTSKIVVGNTFNVTIKISSSTALGSWEFTPSYDSSMLQLTSGDSYVVGYAEDGNTKSKSYSYKFKSLKTGTATISVKSYGAYAWNESKLSISANSKNISIITQAQLEASYSKNNNLKSLSIDDLELTPEFNKDTLEYKAEAESNTTSINIKANVDDSKSSISGTGTHEVSEGENKFNITVTAQNGSTKTYTIIINVIDPNPIEIEINNEKYILVKRESLLECPENYEPTKVTIEEQEIPGFYNEINKFTLVGLKDKESKIQLFLYDKDTKTYTKYNEVVLNEMKIFPLSIDKEFDDIYEKSQTIINEVVFESLKIKNSDYSIIHAKDILTGKDNYYLCDSVLNTIVRYTDENTITLKNEVKKQKMLILILGSETILVIFVLVCVLISKVRKNKKNKKRYKEELEKRKEKEEPIIEQEETLEEETIEEEQKEALEEEQNNETEEIKIEKIDTKKKKSKKGKNK